MAIWISHRASFAILLAGAACLMIAPSASAQAKDAEPATRQANAEVLRSLPFADRADFDDAQRGFIASLPDGLVLGDGQRVVWSMKPYAFQQQAAAPATVNPSLWRQAQLDNFHGLFKVADRVYQVRGLDDSNITIVESDTGLIVIDALLSAETARAAMELYYQHRPRKPVVAVVFTHAHADHFGGVKGVVSESDVRAGRVKIFAPDHFTEHAVTESIIVGNAIRRRGMYQFGPLLPPGERGQIDAGHGKTVSRGTFTLIAPTDLIKDSYELRRIDGLDIEFHLVPGSEAPAEMTLYFPQFKVLDMAEDTNHTMHNLYTIRGAEVRDARLWSSYLGEALDRYGGCLDRPASVADLGRGKDRDPPEAPARPVQVHPRSIRAPAQSRVHAERDRRDLEDAGEPRQRLVEARLLRNAEPQCEGGLPEISRLVRRQPRESLAAAASRASAQGGGIHGRCGRRDRPRAG
jgi:alkyl sulfatase BDS1-like metallo-beta-lactamase superfamily hydrolase